eukprot:9656450-Alexandrium_andersonii.AAC.1
MAVLRNPRPDETGVAICRTPPDCAGSPGAGSTAGRRCAEAQSGAARARAVKTGELLDEAAQHGR